MRPGIVSKDSEGKLLCRPIFSRIVSLFAEQNDLQYAVPGGLIGKYFLPFFMYWSLAQVGRLDYKARGHVIDNQFA